MNKKISVIDIKSKIVNILKKVNCSKEHIQEIFTIIDRYYCHKDDVLDMLREHSHQLKDFDFEPLIEKFRYNFDPHALHEVNHMIKSNKLTNKLILDCPILAVIFNRLFTKPEFTIAFKVRIPYENKLAYYVLSDSESAFIFDKFNLSQNLSLHEINLLFQKRLLKVEFDVTEKTLMFIDVI